MVSTRYLLTVHNVLPHDRHTLWNRILYRFIYRIPSRLIVHTITMRERLVSEFGVCRSRIVVMDHGCELGGHLDPLPRQKSRKPLKLLFFGAVAHYKGVDVLLSAFAMLANDVSLKIIGACRSPQLQHEIERTVAELGSTGRSVSWRNEYVPEEDMAAAFHWADVLVLPYRHIDQSGVVFQALKFGVPIIATRVGEFAQMVTADIGELCEPDDALSLVDAISQLAERIGTISSEKIASIARQYDWANTVRVLRSSYVD